MDQSSLCSILLKEILRDSPSIARFSKKSGISRSTFSLIFRSEEPKSIAFEQLIKITLALGYPEHHFFALYINEYFGQKRFNKNRLEQTLLRCGELGLQDHLTQILKLLDESFSYATVVFAVAEKFNKNDLNDSALLLYRWVATCKEEVSNPIISISHYYVFRSQISMDSSRNRHLIYRFLPYRKHLPAHLNLDALLLITHTLYNHKEYEELDLFANEFISICTYLFGDEKSKNTKNIEFYGKLTERHPVVYYGQAYLVKQACLEGLKKYEEAQFYCQEYGSLDWFQDGSSIAQIEIKKFFIFSKINKWNFELLKGNSAVLPEYINFLHEHPTELIPSLITILEAANTFDFSVDELLEVFEDKLEFLFEDPKSHYSEIANRSNLAYSLHQLAIYHFNAGHMQKSLNTAVKCWNMSQTVNNQQHTRLLASLTALYSMSLTSEK